MYTYIHMSYWMHEKFKVEYQKKKHTRMIITGVKTTSLSCKLQTMCISRSTNG